MKIINVIKDTFNEALPFQWGMSLFSAGCNLSCKMCKGYNYEKVTDKNNIIGEAIELIDKNISPMHDCVVFIGGEPLIWDGNLYEALKYCHDLNLKTKIFTNGICYEEVAKINEQGLCDAWSVDFKVLHNAKEELGIDNKDYIKFVTESIRNIQSYRLPLEIRTTFYKGNEVDREKITKYVIEHFITPYKKENPELYIDYIEQEDARDLLGKDTTC